MLVQYCCGNTAVLHELSFSDAVEIIKNAINDREDEMLYKAYMLTMTGRFTGVSYVDFVNKVKNQMQTGAEETVNVEAVESKIADYLDNYKWEEV